MLDEDFPATYIDLLVENYERHEEYLNALDDSRFAEIYLDDITPRRKALKMKKENHNE